MINWKGHGRKWVAYFNAFVFKELRKATKTSSRTFGLRNFPARSLKANHSVILSVPFSSRTWFYCEKLTRFRKFEYKVLSITSALGSFNQAYHSSCVVLDSWNTEIMGSILGSRHGGTSAFLYDALVCLRDGPIPHTMIPTKFLKFSHF
jgi:hypothetical protein